MASNSSPKFTFYLKEATDEFSDLREYGYNMQVILRGLVKTAHKSLIPQKELYVGDIRDNPPKMYTTDGTHTVVPQVCPKCGVDDFCHVEGCENA